MKNTLLRLLSGSAGLIAALVAIAGTLNVFLLQIDEAQSARQYGGEVSFWGAVGGTATILFFDLFLGVAAYFMLRFSFRGPAATRPQTINRSSTRSGQAEIP